MNTFFKISSGILTLVMAIAAAPAQGLVFNNFSSGVPAWDTNPGPNHGLTVAADDSAYGFASAGQIFTPDASGTLASLSLAMIGNVYATTSVRSKLVGNDDPASTVTLSLFTWDGAALGATALESWVAEVGSDGTSTEITLTSSLQPELVFGQVYALIATAGSGVWAEWSDSLVSGAAGDLGSLNFTDGQYYPADASSLALQVYANPLSVPEPGTLTLAGMGIVGLLTLRRKRGI